MLNPIDVAEYFLWRACQEENDLISNLKLQKLMYYAQGYCLAYLGRPLFLSPISAWQHGPVVEEVYRTYKRYGPEALPCPEQFRQNKYREEERKIMDEVYAIYGQFSAWKLRNMTHQEPLWQRAKDGEVIRIEHLKEYFQTRVNIRPIVVQTEAKSWDDVAAEVLEERHKLWEKLAAV